MNLKVREEQFYETRVSQGSFTHRVLIAAGIILGLVVLLFLIWQLADVLLVVFGGILLGILLRSLSHWLSQNSRLSEAWSLTIVVGALVLIITLAGWLFAPELADQMAQLSESFPQSIERVREYAPEWSRPLMARLPSVDDMMSDNSDMLSRVTRIFSTTLGTVANVLVILTIGIYVAAEPHTYLNNFIRLFSINKRERVRDVLYEVHHTLQRWLVGRIASMAVIGVLTTIGLSLLGVPLALTLGLLAAFLEFVPYVGFVISIVPAAMLGLLEGPTTALYVVLLYIGIQLFESYILTPLVEQRAVFIPPALTITVQLIFGVLIGAVGLLFATPLTAVIMVLVENFYIEDTLNET